MEGKLEKFSANSHMLGCDGHLINLTAEARIKALAKSVDSNGWESPKASPSVAVLEDPDHDGDEEIATERDQERPERPDDSSRSPQKKKLFEAMTNAAYSNDNLEENLKQIGKFESHYSYVDTVT